MSQLDAWKGELGSAYTARNVPDWRQRQPAWRQIVDGLPLQRVLEVGCNRGHNLVALADLLGETAEVVGIEPNPDARKIARGASDRIGVLAGDAYNLPFRDGAFELVFTAGVLIHVSLEDLPRALAEIYRVSSRYVLAVEYFAEEETPIPYRGREDLLWKRDFLRHYQQQFPGLRVVRSGYFGKDEGFDQTHWWLLEKP